MLRLEKLSEFLGALAGDGYISKNCRTYKFGIVMHPTNDLEYVYFLKQIVLDLFDVKPRISFRLRAVRLNWYSKSVAKYMFQLGFPLGKKGDFRVMPIIRKNAMLWPHFIRGFFDTDGCIFWDKRKIYSKPYPRICMYSISSKLLQDLNSFLKEYNFTTTLKKRYKRPIWELELYGHKNLKRWLDLIGSSNKYKLDRLRGSEVEMYKTTCIA